MPTSKFTNENTDSVRTAYIEQGAVESIDPETAQIVTAKDVEAAVDLERDRAFLNEIVNVMIMPSSDENDTTRLVTISVNGKSFNFIRGEWRKVPRYVLWHLAVLKRQQYQFGFKHIQGGNTSQTTSSMHTLRYPHQFEDANPKGIEWYNKIRNQVH